MGKSTGHNETLEVLEQGIRDLTSSERWTAWLESAARFHHYSFGNQMLIALQRPEASRVAGFKTWQTMNRQVRKGEHGIRILAPVVCNRRDNDGEKTGDTFLRFRSVAVFDVAQTDGADLPEIAFQLAGEGPKGAWSALESFARSIDYTVSVEPTGEANGWCRHSDKVIAVKDTNDEAMQVKTLAHELGHALMHEAGVTVADRQFKELEAESVAFVVCRALGLDSGDYSFGYVAGWARDGDNAIKALKACAGRIHDAAGRILSWLEKTTDPSELVAA
ncbi:MAG: ArdC-like ssDNA-binding domain-containing protein [Acidimicrobiales bacterium]